MKNIILVLTLVLISSLPAFAQDAATTPPADMKERIELATKFHKVRSLKDKKIDPQIGIAGKNLKMVEEQSRFIDDMKAAIDYKKAEAFSIQTMAETFTPDEIKALTAFYSNPAGASASDKMSQYQAKVTPEIARLMDEAYATTKYGKKK